MTLSYRTRLRSVLRAGADLILGPSDENVLGQIARRDVRASTFFRVMEFVNYERVEGDILEFGVFGGLTLALLAEGHRCDPKGMTRRVVGFDSFQGLPGSDESHARWREGDCATTQAWHPHLAIGEPVSAEATIRLFEACGLPAPELERGAFEDTLAGTLGSKYDAAAVVHIDCDLYESTKTVLEALTPTLQDGTVVLFDDWFHYRGNPNKGEARAFGEFLEIHHEWRAQPYQTYGTFCNSFVLYRQ